MYRIAQADPYCAHDDDAQECFLTAQVKVVAGGVQGLKQKR